MSPDPIKMREEIKGHASISDQIRALARAGYSRGDIAKFLDRRYQQVRNVLVGDEQSDRRRVTKRAKDLSSLATDTKRVPALRAASSGSETVRVDHEGRVHIPPRIREALGLRSGDALFARLEDGEIHLLTPNAAMRRAQAMVRQFVPEGVSLVDELIADRRREIERDRDHG